MIKVNNGILLHDLRNDWVDDLYLLMGQSYFYQKKFDSAYEVFQYINYNFQPRSKDEIGFEKSIGSNVNAIGNIFNIASKENKFSLVFIDDRFDPIFEYILIMFLIVYFYK